ncbi:MAG: hypothetical protein HQL06_17090 [Nitrospirae bacterium]|nr:hypothetical protein [Nitrospirota bacterium]
MPPRDRKDYAMKLLYLFELKMLYNKIKREVENMPITIDVKKSGMYKDGLLEGQRKGLIEGKRQGLIEGIEAVL